MALIFFLSSRPASQDVFHLVSDKVVHAGVYSVLAGLLVRAFTQGWRRPVTIGACAASALMAALYGVSDELHQSFVPSRHMDASDLIADAIGALGAASALYAWGIIRARNVL